MDIILAKYRLFIERKKWQAAVEMIDRIETAIRENWEKICEEAELSPVDKNFLWGRQFLNPFSIGR
jgi:serine/threonine-protein kinase HipA